jgi:hypothetical protein
LAVGGAAGAADGAVGSPSMSVFQQDCAVVRVRQNATWAPLAVGAVQIVPDVKW